MTYVDNSILFWDRSFFPGVPKDFLKQRTSCLKISEQTRDKAIEIIWKLWIANSQRTSNWLRWKVIIELKETSNDIRAAVIGILSENPNFEIMGSNYGRGSTIISQEIIDLLFYIREILES